VVPLNDHDALERVFRAHGPKLAGAIIEPIPANNGLLLQERSFLQRLRELCTAHGALLIFDEVISGFRAGFAGSFCVNGIVPDLVTYGKIIGGGMPVGAYGGRLDLMKHIAPEGPVYQAGTLSGNPVAMAAGLAQLTECLKPGFYEALEAKTATLCSIVNTHGLRLPPRPHQLHLLGLLRRCRAHPSRRCDRKCEHADLCAAARGPAGARRVRGTQWL
jgi:glutamate-1-semialdehyde 2,1-aminomutase